MKVKYKEWLNKIEKTIGYRPLHKEVARILHHYNLVEDAEKARNALGNRFINDGWLPYEWRKALDEHYYLEMAETQRGAEALKDMCEIPYWEGAKDCIQELVNPNVTRPKVGDIEYITKELNCKPEFLRIIAAPDNRMNGEPTRIEQTNVLLIDLEENNCANEGVYFYTTKGKIAGIARIRVDINGDVVFMFDNKIYQTKALSCQKLKEIDFKVIGRVILNYSQKII